MLYMTPMLRLVALAIMARNAVLAAPNQDVREVEALEGDAPMYVYYSTILIPICWRLMYEH
jgi:hypothetical protein